MDSGLMRMKPAHCWKLFGPRPLTSFSCSRLKKGPFFSLHSMMLRARPAFKPATCLQEHTKKKNISIACSVAYTNQWTFENAGIFNRHWLSISCISHLTATLKSSLFLELVTATDVNTSLILYILGKNYTLKVHPRVWKFYFILITSLHIHVWNISTNIENIFQSSYPKVS